MVGVSHFLNLSFDPSPTLLLQPGTSFPFLSHTLRKPTVSANSNVLLDSHEPEMSQAEDHQVPFQL